SCERTIVLHLSGQSIRHRPGAPLMRHFAYELLQTAIDLIVALGHRGLFLLIDEVESIYTKLPNVRSRRGAHRVLSALCESRPLQRCKVVLAITPDARRAFQTDIPLMLEANTDLQCEPVRQWATRLSTDALITAACSPLDRPARARLLKQVRALYVRTYPHAQKRLREHEWQGFVRDVLSRTLPVRLLVRQTVDFLDGQRYSPN